MVSFCEHGNEPSGSVKEAGYFWKTEWRSAFQIFWTMEEVSNKVSAYLSTNAWRRNGSGDIAPRILNLGTRWRWVVSFTHRPSYHLGSVTATCWTGGWSGLWSCPDAVAETKILSLPPLGTECRSSSPRPSFHTANIRGQFKYKPDSFYKKS
jgi:hypothetical protein